MSGSVIARSRTSRWVVIRFSTVAALTCWGSERRELAAHPFAKGELADRGDEEGAQVETVDQLVAACGPAGPRQAVDRGQDAQGLGQRRVPPELGPLAEYDTDPPGQVAPLYPTDSPGATAKLISSTARTAVCRARSGPLRLTPGSARGPR